MSSRLSGKPLAQSSELKRTVFFPGYLITRMDSANRLNFVKIP